MQYDKSHFTDTSGIRYLDVKRKASLAALFIALYGVALLKPALPLLEYAIKMDVYLEQCINKQKPELQCNGQCVLMQKLKSLNPESSTPIPPEPVEVNLQDYPIGFIETILIAFPTIKKTSPADSSRDLVLYNFVIDIFHPPSVRA